MPRVTVIGDGGDEGVAQVVRAVGIPALTPRIVGETLHHCADFVGDGDDRALSSGVVAVGLSIEVEVTQVGRPSVGRRCPNQMRVEVN